MILAAIFLGLFWAAIALIGCSAFGWPYWVAAVVGVTAASLALGFVALCGAAANGDRMTGYAPSDQDDQEGVP